MKNEYYEEEVANKIWFAEIPLKFQTANLSEPSHTEMGLVVQTFVANWPHGDSMFLAGPTGTGKTYLACAAVNEIFRLYPELHTDALFFNTNTDLPRLLDNRYFRRYDSYRDKINALEQRSIVIIDDLGHVPNVEWAKDIIYRIYEARYQSGFTTITTLNGNYPIGEDGLPDLSPLSALFNEPFVRRLVDTSIYTYCE